MENLSKRDKQTLRFLEWVKQYPGWWHLIEMILSGWKGEAKGKDQLVRDITDLLT